MTRDSLAATSVTQILGKTVGELDTVDLRGGGEPRGVSSEGSADPSQRYVEVGELGRGGLGEVIEAFDRDLRRSVAIKRPLPEREDRAALTSLIREAQITAQLEHPNVPAIHSLEVDEKGRPFFTMTRLGGTTLAALCRGGIEGGSDGPALSLARKLRIFLQVGYAVAFAHSRGVIHRDLKPENVIIGDFGEVRLMDWGVAKLLDRPDDPVAEEQGPAISLSVSKAATREGQFVGTPGYAAPEQVEGSGAVDERSDVYGLGAVLYELISGKRPAPGKTAMEVLLNTLEGNIPSLGTVAPVSDRLVAVVDKALALDPNDRYQTVLEMLQDVEAFLEGRPVKAREESLWRRFSRWYGGRPPELARLKLWHIDSAIFGGGFMLGVAGGIAVAGYLSEGWLWWAGVIGSLIVGVIGLAPFFYTVLRPERYDDPGVVQPLIEGIATTSSSPRSGRSGASARPTRAEGRGKDS